MGGLRDRHTAQDVGGTPVLSTIIANNVVSGNTSGGIYRVGEHAGEPGDLHDRKQSDRDQRRRDGGAGQRLGRASRLASVENASILDNVISANAVGVAIFAVQHAPAKRRDSRET